MIRKAMGLLAKLKSWVATFRGDRADAGAPGRVEQVFLIHRETGLLLEHVHIWGGELPDADHVSGQLMAITQFVSDAFNDLPGDLQNLSVGDLDVCIETGPHAVLAVILRGGVPTTLAEQLHSTLDQIHNEFGEELAAYSGESAAIRRSRAQLEQLLRENHWAGTGSA